MSRRPLAWLRGVLPIGGAGRRDPADADEREGSATATEPEGPRSSLFECANCDRTYIGVEMESCSRCGGSVEEIPGERDLQAARSEG